MTTPSPSRDVRLPSPHPAQLRVISQAKRFNVLSCGRRFGKTTLGEICLVTPAVLDGEPVAYFAPTYKMMAEVWRDVRRMARPVTARVDAQQHRLELLTGGVIDMWSLDSPDVARGRKYARAVIDEAAMVADLAEAWQSVIRPTLADYRGDAWLMSTPKGRNFFQTAYEWGQDPEQVEWASWQMPTAENPYIDASEIEAMRLEMPERIFAQEILAMFLDDAGGVFRRVMAAATATRQEAAADGHSYVIGVDWGKKDDFTVLAVIDTSTMELVEIDRFNQIDYLIQVGRLRALWERFGRPPVIPEQNSMGEPLVEQLQRIDGMYVQPFQTTNASKARIIDGLALAFERGTFRILPDPVLVAELQAYEMERLPGGSYRYGAPAGMHDDCVMATALAYDGASVPEAAGGSVDRDGSRGGERMGRPSVSSLFRR